MLPRVLRLTRTHPVPNRVLWRTPIRASVLGVALLLIAGCQAGPPVARQVQFVPHSDCVTMPGHTPADHVPPRPSLVPRSKTCACPIHERGQVESCRLPLPTAPADRASSTYRPGEGAALSAPEALASLAPVETSGASELPTAASSPPASGPTAAEGSDASMARRLVELESDLRNRSAVLAELATQDAAQTDVLRRLTAALEQSQHEIRNLEQALRRQQREDVESLRELASALDRLLDTAPASARPETD